MHNNFSIKPDVFLLAALPFVLFLLFWNLGGEYLWYDECSIAAMGENILQYGYPKADYKGTVIWSHNGYRLGDAYISRPWMEMYIAALENKVFGKNNFSARVIFTFFGFLSVLWTFFLAGRVLRDRFASRVSLILIATSVPFLLMMRQCAYYSLVTIGTLWVVWYYMDMLEERRGSFWRLFFVSLFLLFANHGIFLMVFSGILAHYFLFSRSENIKKSMAVLTAVFACLFAVIAWFFKGAEHFSTEILAQFYPNISYYVRTVYKYVVPLRFYFFLGIVLLLIYRRKIASLKKEINELKPFQIFICIFAVSILLLSLEKLRYFRYIVFCLPLFAVLNAYMISLLYRISKILGTAVLAVIIFTNALYGPWIYLPMKLIAPVLKKTGLVDDAHEKKISEKSEIKFYFSDYIYEITHKYEGPFAKTVQYLEKHAKSGDKFKTSYNALGITYYTGLQGNEDYGSDTWPEWIILRKYWVDRKFYFTENYRKMLALYEPIQLDAADLPWENRPDDMEYHYFKTAPIVEKMTLYSKINR